VRFRRLPVIALALAAAAIPGARADDGNVVALVGGEIHTASGAVVRGGTIVVRDGRIEAVGDAVAVPAGARRIELNGAIVTPGFVDADGSLPLPESDRYGPRWGVDERVAEALDLGDERFGTALRQGVTAFLVTGDARGNFSGTSALVVNGSPPSVLDADGPFVATLATPDLSGGVWGGQRFAEVRGIYVEARERREAFARWRRDLLKFEEKRAAEPALAVERLLLPPELLEDMSQWTPERRAAWREAALKSAGREKDWTKPKEVAKPPARPGPDAGFDLVLRSMDAKSGVRTILRTQSAADVDAALSLAAEFGLTATIAGGEGLAAAAKDLVRAKTPVVVSDLADTAMRSEGPLAGRAPGLAARLVAAGLRPAISSGGAGGGARFLRLLAAREIGEGLDPEDALRAVTLWAAEAAGSAGRLGSIEPGRRADLVVWDGDPFAAATKTRLVMVGGVEAVLDAR
jgi:imidazolonepropionase-like amidohydrolase